MLHYAHVFLVLAGISLAGCEDAAAPARGRQHLTIAEASQPAFALLYVAEAKGFFKSEGVDVDFVPFVLGRDALNSVLEGKADLATAFQPPVVARLCEGKDLAVISTLHTSSRNQAVIARRDHGIEKPRDLVGKRLGVTRISMEYFVSIFLASEGIRPADVLMVEVEPAAYAERFLGGSLDAVAVFNPHQFDLRRQLGDRATLFYTDAYVEFSMLAGTREMVLARLEAIQRLLRAVVRAEQFIEKNREESIDIVVAKLAGKFDEAVIREGWDNFKPVARLDNVLLTVMRVEANWLSDSGRIGCAVPDVARAILPDALHAARPLAVTIAPAPPH